MAIKHENPMAAPIITCPACTKKFKGKEGIQGKRIKCPLCSTPFVVPADGGAQVKAGPATEGGIQLKKEAPTAQAQGHQRVVWTKEDDDGTPYKMGEFDERPRCPNCANLLEHSKAVICLYCGYNTQTREWGQTVKAMSVTGGQHFAHLLPGIFFLFMLILFIVGILFFSLELPAMVAGTWADKLDHESVRMWTILLALMFMWAFGLLAFRRLVLNPKPKEKEKD
jgi:hypothetical protein